MLSKIWHSLLVTLLASNIAVAVANAIPGRSPKIKNNKDSAIDVVTVVVTAGAAAQTPAAHTSGRFLHHRQVVTLKPASHWDHNRHDLNNLKPIDSHNIYFTDTGTASLLYLLSR